MKTYKIVITPDAKSDIRNIRDYIAEKFFAPKTAKNYIHSIREEIAKLNYVASVIAPVPEEPWHSRKIRRLSSKEFFIYYRIEESTDTVYILNIIYQKRDQIRFMSNNFKE